VNTG